MREFEEETTFDNRAMNPNVGARQLDMLLVWHVSLLSSMWLRAFFSIFCFLF